MEERKLLTMDEIHDVELDLLKEFHKWCEENDARYSITYGTLIGQIRYQGFIPWDNDVDVMMPRPDYDRLVEFYKQGNKIGDNIELVHHELDDTYHTSFARITDTNTSVQFDYLTEQFKYSGVWVDIFPLDGYYPEKHTKLKEKWRLFNRKLYLIHQYDNKGNPKLYYTKKFLKLFIHNKHNSCVRRLDKMIRKNPYDGDNLWVADLTQPYPCYLEKKQFDDLALVPFEDTQLYAIKDYDAYLRSMYGDYLTPPPESEQETHQYNAYWTK